VNETLIVDWAGRRLTMAGAEVGIGLTNELAPLACGHRHEIGDRIWMSAWPGRVILCATCAQHGRVKSGDSNGPDKQNDRGDEEAP
jgi:hypothetical protein